MVSPMQRVLGRDQYMVRQIHILSQGRVGQRHCYRTGPEQDRAMQGAGSGQDQDQVQYTSSRTRQEQQPPPPPPIPELGCRPGSEGGGGS